MEPVAVTLEQLQQKVAELEKTISDSKVKIFELENTKTVQNKIINNNRIEIHNYKRTVQSYQSDETILNKKIKELQNKLSNKHVFEMPESEDFNKLTSYAKHKKIQYYHKLLSIILNEFFEKINAKPVALFFQIDTTSNLFNFKDKITRLNCEHFEQLKYIPQEELSDSQRSNILSTMYTLNKDQISDKSFHKLTVGKLNTPSLRTIKAIKSELDSKVLRESFFNPDTNESSSILEVEFALHWCIRMLELRKKKVNKLISDLQQPIVIRLSIDGTQQKSKSFVNYVINGYETNDEDYSSEHYSTVVAILNCQENYDDLNTYADKLHKTFQKYIDENKKFLYNNTF